MGLNQLSAETESGSYACRMPRTSQPESIPSANWYHSTSPVFTHSVRSMPRSVRSM